MNTKPRRAAKGPPDLTVHRNTRERRERHAARDALLDAAKTHGQDIDGWGLVVYRRSGKEKVMAGAYYFVADPMDAFHLPDMARSKLTEII